MPRTTPLLSTVQARGGVLDEDAGWTVARDFGDAAGEAAAGRTGAIVADVSGWGVFTLDGKNAVKFLQGLVTNDVAKLVDGEGCYAAFLNVHGRIEAVTYIFRLADARLLLFTPPEATEWVERSLGRFRLAGGFDLVLRDGNATITVQGPRASATLGAALGVEIPPSAGPRALEIDGAGLVVLSVPRSLEGGADVTGPEDAIAALFDRLVASDARPAGSDALGVLAMEAGIPRFGRDFDAETVLQEADVPEIVSYTKGCYLGQEIVARIHFQGQPSKLLRRLAIAGDVVPEPGDELVAADDETKVAGRVTSTAISAALGPIVFGVVKRKYYAPDTALRVRRGEVLVPATVAVRPPAGAVEETR